SPGGGFDPTQSPVLAAREVNLGMALRSAALKLIGDLPTLAEQDTVIRATDPRHAYEHQIDKCLADPRFAGQLLALHTNALKTGAAPPATWPSRETAPVSAAMVVINDRPYTDIFTATGKTCPTLDAKTGAFTDGDCNNGVPVTAGVLTDPGVQSQFVSN